MPRRWPQCRLVALSPQPGMPKLITVNSWNEWTEGSYLEPDTGKGFSAMEIKKRIAKRKGVDNG